jgi:hypothetical protein
MRSLLDLPPELHNAIASNLYYVDFINFGRALAPRVELSPSPQQLKLILFQTERGEGSFGDVDELPCYRCLKVKDFDEFLVFDDEDYVIERNGGHFWVRACLGCDIIRRHEAEGQRIRQLKEV